MFHIGIGYGLREILGDRIDHRAVIKDQIAHELALFRRAWLAWKFIHLNGQLCLRIPLQSGEKPFVQIDRPGQVCSTQIGMRKIGAG